MPLTVQPPQLNSGQVIRIYGGNPPGDQQVQSGEFGSSNQYVTEVLVPGTYRRMFRGPKIGGHFSVNTFVDSAGGATSAMTVWYSNLPSPDITGTLGDGDWFQDTTIGTVDLTSTAVKFANVGNVDAEWVMLKVVVVTSNASIRSVVRVEGTTHGKTG